MATSPTPRISGFSPASAKAGDEIRIRGKELGGTTAVRIGGVSATVTYRSETELWVVVPALPSEANPVEATVGSDVVRAPAALRRVLAPLPPVPPPPPSALQQVSSALGFASSVVGGVRGGGGFGGAASSGRAVYGAAGGVGGAMASASGQVFSSVADIGSQGLGAVLSPLGATGQGLAGIGQAGLQTGATFLSSGLQIGGTVAAGALGAGVTAAMLPIQLAGGLLGAGGGLLSGLGSAVGGLGGATFGVASVAGGALSLGGSALSGLGSLVGMATGAVTKIFETILQGAQSVVKVVGDGLGELGKLAGSVLSGILTVGQDVLSEARNYGRNIRNIGFQTGIGDARAGSIANTYAFAGVSPQALGSAFSSPQNTIALEMRARMMGLPSPTGDAQGFLLGGANAMNRARQGGLMGAMMFNAMAGPQMTGAFGSAFDLGPERLQRNMNLAESFKLPGNMGEFSRDLDAFSIAVEALGRNLKLTLAEVLVPLMPMINQGFSWIIQNKDAIVGAVKTVGQWVTVELPQYIMHGGAAILRVTSTVFDKVGTYLTDGFQKFMTGVIQNLPSTLKALDEFLNGMRHMASVTIGLGAAVSQYASDFFNSPTGKAVATAMGINPNATGATGGSGSQFGANVPSPSMNPSQSVMPTGNAPQGPGANTSGLIPPNATYYSGKIPFAKPTGSQVAQGYAGAALGGLGGLVLDTARVAKTVFVDLPGAYADGGWSGFKKAYADADAHAFDSTAAGMRTGFYFGSGGFDIDPKIQGQKSKQQQQQAAAHAAAVANGTAGNPMLPQAGRTPGQAFQDAQQWFLDTIPASNIQSQQSNISNILSSMQGTGNTLGDWMKENAPGLREKADTLDNWADSWKQQMLDAATRNADASEAVASHTDRSAQASLDLLRALGPNFFSRLMAQTSAIIAEDYAMNALRVS